MELPTRTSLATRRLRFWRQPWFLTVLAIQAATVFIYGQQESVDQWRPAIYVVGLAASASFWLLLNLLRDRLSNVGQYLLGGLVAALVSILIGGSYAFFIEFGEFFSSYHLRFALSSSGAETLRYAAGYFVYPYNVLFSAAIAIGGAVWGLGEEIPFDNYRHRRNFTAAVTAVFLVTGGVTSAMAPRTQLPPDVAAVTAVTRAPVTSTGERFRAGDRTSVPTLEETESVAPPNILFVIVESWGKKRLSFYGANRTPMPFLSDWIDRESDNFVVFDRAYANSTATELSVSSLLTGAGPWEGEGKLHEMPLLWDWARAAGLHPFFVTTQNYQFRGLDDFFFSKANFPIRTLHRSGELPRNERFRVDEVQIAGQVLEMVDRVPEDERFVGVYNPNALHEPAQEKSPELEEQPDFPTRYENALHILDRSLERIVEGLRERGRLDRTLVVLTADHGSGNERTHVPPRIASFYEEFTNIPMAVRLPPGRAEKAPGSADALRANSDRNVANLDLVPTLADALGARRRPEATELYGRLGGYSLLRPVPRDRAVLVLNTNSLRQWEHRGFGIYWNDWRFVFSDIEGAGLYDLREDRDQTRDLWKRAPDPVRQKVLQTIDEHRHLEQIWNTYSVDPERTPLFR